MLSCKDITEKANQYLDKEVSLFTRVEMKIHMFICDNCKRYVEQLRTTIAALGKMNTPAEVVDDGKIDQIINTIKKHNSN